MIREIISHVAAQLIFVLILFGVTLFGIGGLAFYVATKTGMIVLCK